MADEGMFRSEKHLQSLLDEHDQLILKCVSGELPVREFLARYSYFFQSYALDGHESPEDEQALFARYADRIAIHQEIWETIETRITEERFVGRTDAHGMRFIGEQEALERMKHLARKHLGYTDPKGA